MDLASVSGMYASGGQHVSSGCCSRVKYSAVRVSLYRSPVGPPHSHRMMPMSTLSIRWPSTVCPALQSVIRAQSKCSADVGMCPRLRNNKTGYSPIQVFLLARERSGPTQIL